MLQTKIKRFKSIDGFFNKKITLTQTSLFSGIKSSKLSILGKGNSISGIPYSKKSLTIKPVIKENIFFIKSRNEIKVNGNIEVYKIHNFLLKKKFYFPSFPSFPNVSVGACIANCVHGNDPKNGVIKSFINEIELYNPNFGFKILSKKKNKKLFDLTIGGMGMTGIIVNAKLKVLKLKSSYIKIQENIKFTNLNKIYNYLRNSKYIYNQNNIFINYSKKNFILGRVSSGDFVGNKFKNKELTKKKISPLRLNIFKFSLLKKIIEKLILIKEFNLKNKILHINEALFPSNSKILYFNLINKKFVEHQTIIPHRNVEKFLAELESIIKLKNPLITLCHLKIFKGNSKHLQFDGKGLGLSIHISINKNFYRFNKDLMSLNKKYNCVVNIYKNSNMDIKKIKNIYHSKYKIFSNEIKKINKKYFFTNAIFDKLKFY